MFEERRPSDVRTYVFPVRLHASASLLVELLPATVATPTSLIATYASQHLCDSTSACRALEIATAQHSLIQGTT